MEPAAMTSLLALMAGEGLLAVDLQALARGPSGPGGTERRAGAVAVLPVAGVMLPRTRSGGWSGPIPGMDALRSALAGATVNPDISAIVLDVDSPGGTVVGTAETAAAVRAAAAVKPVIAVANGMAASAAYWIISGATEIVAAPAAELGSIGVVMMHQSWARAYDRMGVDTTMIQSSPFKTEVSSFAPLTDEARANLQSRVDSSHREFVSAGASGRKVSAAYVEERFGRGRLVDAADAVAAGMADRVASLDTVIGELLNGAKPRAFARRADVFAFV